MHILVLTECITRLREDSYPSCSSLSSCCRPRLLLIVLRSSCRPRENLPANLPRTMTTTSMNRKHTHSIHSHIRISIHFLSSSTGFSSARSPSRCIESDGLSTEIAVLLSRVSQIYDQTFGGGGGGGNRGAAAAAAGSQLHPQSQSTPLPKPLSDLPPSMHRSLVSSL